MDKNRVEGAAKQVKGSIKEAIGKVTGDRTTEAKGAAEKAEGKVQANVGKAADKVKDVLKK
ncbi:MULTISPECIES: CsbD family protein [unclassified Caballeronia]|uniref:CsbD family protein n=1 Tax=unclassified Caballeronia TaxID=2646786 RepID=UPI00202979E5|nr:MULTISPECIES: CsbD family protein [unclassified Caballeronia]